MPLKILEPLSLAVKYLSVLILWGAWLGCTRPLGARPGFSPAPKGVLPPRIRPERADANPEKIAITGENRRFGARGAGDFHFSCVLCRSKGRVDAYAPEAAELVGAKPLHLAAQDRSVA